MHDTTVHNDNNTETGSDVTVSIVNLKSPNTP